MGSDDEASFEKTGIFAETAKIEMDPDYQVPPCLVLLVGPADQMGRQWVIDKPSMTMGRNPEADIHVLDASLSKVHAKVELRNNIVTITDLGSTNSTTIDGKKLEPNKPRVLKNNDQVRAANLVFKYLQHGILSETAEKERMQSELEKARTVQETLFPKNSEAQYEWVQIGGKYQSATECGGDWWWHWSVGDKAFAIIGDATGHGAAAALITSAARSAMAAIEGDPSVGVEKVYSTLSHAIRTCSGGRLAMSAFIVEIGLLTKKMRYVNASHLPAVLLPKHTAGLSWKDLESLGEPISSALGGGESRPKVGEVQAPESSRLVLLTDGLTERADEYGKALSERAFFNALIQVHYGSLNSQSEFLSSLVMRSDELAAAAPLADDITVVALDFN